MTDRKSSMSIAGSEALAAATLLSSDAKPDPELVRPAGDPGAPPRRLSVVEASPHFDVRFRRVGVMLDGEIRPSDVAEYDQDGGWIRTLGGRVLHGVVEPFWRSSPVETAASVMVRDDEAHLSRAEEKRRRRAERNARVGR